MAEPVRRLNDGALLSEVPLSTRVQTALGYMGLKTIGELRRVPDAELLRTPNLGRKSLKEIREMIPAAEAQEQTILDSLRAFVRDEIARSPKDDDLLVLRASFALQINSLEKRFNDLAVSFDEFKKIVTGMRSSDNVTLDQFSRAISALRSELALLAKAQTNAALEQKSEAKDG